MCVYIISRVCASQGLEVPEFAGGWRVLFIQTDMIRDESLSTGQPLCVNVRETRETLSHLEINPLEADGRKMDRNCESELIAHIAHIERE
jgi:hypothetical protein